MQGPPGQTLPGPAGERGLAGEKVSQTKPLALKAHSQSMWKMCFLLKPYDVCCLSG